VKFEECEEPGEGKLMLANGNQVKECIRRQKMLGVYQGPEASHETR
jgi:hypothetical protein